MTYPFVIDMDSLQIGHVIDSMFNVFDGNKFLSQNDCKFEFMMVNVIFATSLTFACAF